MGLKAGKAGIGEWIGSDNDKAGSLELILEAKGAVQVAGRGSKVGTRKAGDVRCIVVVIRGAGGCCSVDTVPYGKKIVEEEISMVTREEFGFWDYF